MRPLEMLLLAVDVPLVAWCVYRRGKPTWAWLVACLALVVLALHLGLEGYRWQLAPGYLATLFLLPGSAWPTGLKAGFCLGILALILLSAAAVLGTILPVFSFPTPTGPFVIGSTTRHLIDRARAETQAPVPGQHRELMIKIWYPADQTGTREVYRAGRPLTLLNHHLRLVRLHSFLGVPLAKSPPRFPVVIVSPAWTSLCTDYVYLAEELASHGFLVVGIDHPYGSHQTIFPDGRIIGTVMNRFLDYSSDEALRASLPFVEAQLAIRAADVRFTLDELERLDRDDPDGLLIGRIDFSRVAACGHSFGGAVAADVCLSDARFKAGVDLDGLLFGPAATKSIGKPFLFFEDDDTTVPSPTQVQTFVGQDRCYWTFMFQNARCIRASMTGSDGYWLKLRGANHMNFHDRALYTPLRRLTDAGPIPPLRALEVTNAYVVAFLQTHLNGTASPLLDAASPRYPEVEFERVSKGER